MTEVIDWQTYNGSRLADAGFNQHEFDALHELFKETRVNSEGIDRVGFLGGVRYNSVLVGSNTSGITALGVYNYQPFTKNSFMYVEALAVDEQYRRRGIGSLVLTNVIREAMDLECATVRLSSRKGVVQFYKAHGFSYDYSTDTKSPYVPMRLDLSRVNLPKETTLRTLAKSV